MGNTIESVSVGKLGLGLIRDSIESEKILELLVEGVGDDNPHISFWQWCYGREVVEVV